MKFPLPLLLLLPLHAAVAQYRPIYSTPRPSYVAPRSTYTPSTSTNSYRAQQRSQQQAHQTFQRMQDQQLQQMQQRYYYNHSLTKQQLAVLRRPLSTEQLAQVQARQQQAEQKATEQLTQLAQQQQRQRDEHPAADAQQAAAQQLADTRQLTALSVKTYREVFLPGQLLSALQSLAVPGETQQTLQALNHDLLDNTWWSKEAAQAPAKVVANGNTLAALTTSLLGFDLASPPPTAPPATSTLDEALAHDTFDRLAAAQLLQAAAQAEKRAAGAPLAQAVQQFQALTTQLAASQAPPQSPKQQRNAVKKSLRHVNQELARYQAHVGSTGSIAQAQKTILKSTGSYLAKK